MSGRRYAAGPRCGIDGCKSTRYYRADGQTFCKNNHLAAGVLEFAIDEDEALASGIGNRRSRVAQISRDKVVSKVQRGKAGYAVFLQSFQIILRHQARFISKVLSIPYYEPLLKDLWAMFLSAQNAGDLLPEIAADVEEDLIIASANGSEAEPENTGNVYLDPSRPDAETAETVWETKSLYVMHRPILIHSISLNYIALLLLRVPVTIRDFRNWIVSGEFPYMRAIQCVPADVLERLDAHYWEALQPQIRPRTTRIWKWTQQTALFLKTYSGIQVPPLNYRPVLYSMIKDVFLPVEIMVGIVKILDELPIDLGIEVSRTKILHMVVAKLYYCPGAGKRVLGAADEPAARGPNMKQWQHLLTTSISKVQGIDSEMKTEAGDVLKMTDSSCDAYLDWFSKTWLGKDTRRTMNGVSSGILDLFPIGKPGSNQPESMELDTEDKLQNIKWLYSYDQENVRIGQSTIGKDYFATPTERPISNTIFDDLVELLSLQFFITNYELRKQVSALEVLLQEVYPAGLDN